MAQYKFIEQPEQYKFLNTPAEEVPVLDAPIASGPQEPKLYGKAEGNIKESAKAAGSMVKGTAEAVVQMGASFVGALPATVLGLYDAVKNKDHTKFPDAFKAVQEAFTVGPWSEEGKDVSAGLEDLITKYGAFADKHLVDPNLEDGKDNVLAAVMGKVSSEAILLLTPFLLGGKGKTGKRGPDEATPKGPTPEAPLGGEYIPREEVALIEQNPRRESPSEIPAAERVTPSEIAELAADKKALSKLEEQTYEVVGPMDGELIRTFKAKDKADVFAKENGLEVLDLDRTTIRNKSPHYELLPKDTIEAKVVDFELAKAKKNTIVEWTDWKDIEEVILEDPYKKGGSLEPGEVVPIDPNKPTMMYGGGPGWNEIQSGLVKVWDVIDTSNAMKDWRQFSRPLQAGDPFVAGQVKDFANLKRVHIKERIDNLKALDQISPGTRETMIRAIEDPTLRDQLSPEINSIIDNLIAENESLSQQALDLGIIGNIRKPYAPHILKTVGKGPFTEQLLKQGHLKTGVRPAGTRKYSTFEAGEAEGISYVTDIKAMVDINYQLKDAIIGRHFVNYVKQWKTPTGEELIGFAGQETPTYVSINHPAFQEKTFITKEFVNYKGKKYYVKDDKVVINDTPIDVIKGEIYIDGRKYSTDTRPDIIVKDLKVHPDIAGPLKAVLEADNPNILVRGLTKLKAATIAVIMYNPAFHNFTVFSKLIPTLPGAGVGEFIWNPKKTIGTDVYDALGPVQKALTRTWISDYIVGNYLKSVDANVIDAIKHNVVPLGGRGYRADLYGEIEPLKKNILHNFSATEKLGEAVSAFGDFWHGTLLWDRIGDAQMGLYNRYTIDFMEKGLKAFVKDNGREPTIKELAILKEDSKYMAGEFSNTIVGVFGREDFGNAWKHFLNNVLFSRSYTMSNVRLAEYGLGIIPKHLIGQMRLMDPATAHKVFSGYASYVIMKDLFLMLGTLYGINYAITKYNNIPDKNGEYGGHLPSENEPGKELHIAIGQKPDGTIIYSGIPFRAARDIFEMVTQPTTLWNNKMNPSIKVLYEELTNRNWKGKQIRSEGGDILDKVLQSAEHMTKGLTGWDTLYNTFDPDDESWRNRYRLLGAQISQGAPGGMVAGNIRGLQREQQSQKDLVMAEAVDLSKRGKEKEAIALLSDNKLVGEIPGFVLRSKDPYASLLINLDMGNLYLHATPKQKEELDKIKFGRKAP